MRELHLALLENDARMLVEALLSQGEHIAYWQSYNAFRISSDYRIKFEDQENQIFNFVFGFEDGQVIEYVSTMITLRLSGIRQYTSGPEVLYHSLLKGGSEGRFPEALKSRWNFIQSWLKKNFITKKCSYGWNQYIGPEANSWQEAGPSRYIIFIGEQPKYEEVIPAFTLNGKHTRDGLGNILPKN